MTHRIRTLERARIDIDDTITWIRDVQQADAGARAWFDAYTALRERLRSNPEGYGFAPEDAFVDFELRQAFFKTRRGRRYRVLFTVVDDEVRILRVRAPGLDLVPEDELDTEEH